MSLLGDLKQLFFPHICSGCGTDILHPDSPICLRCTTGLPVTNFHTHDGNPVEKHFWGRLPVLHATAFCHFNTGSMIQHLLHDLKYRGNRELGLYLGRLMGKTLQLSGRFDEVSALVPLPLFPAREKKRGYNQSALLCEGMSEVMQVPVAGNAVIRLSATDTQTQKTREQRWQNMQGKFQVNEPSALASTHVLLVDDVVTTGATLEACGRAILSIEGAALSIATLAYAV